MFQISGMWNDEVREVPCGSGRFCGVQGLLLYMLQLYFHYLISTFSEPCYNSTPKKSHQPQKVTLPPQKSQKSQKKSKIFFFFLVPFGYKNVDKMFHQPQKVI